MRFLMLALINIALISGCASRPAVSIEPCGPDDFLKVPVGTKMEIKLPFLDDQIHTLTTKKEAVWASINCWDRLEKYK